MIGTFGPHRGTTVACRRSTGSAIPVRSMSQQTLHDPSGASEGSDTAGQGGALRLVRIRLALVVVATAMVSAAASVTVDNGQCTAASVAVGGLTPKATRCSAVEQALVGQALTDETIAAAAAAVSNDLGDDILGDIHASADYRRQVAPVFVKRALKQAAGRAG